MVRLAEEVMELVKSVFLFSVQVGVFEISMIYYQFMLSKLFIGSRRKMKEGLRIEWT